MIKIKEAIIVEGRYDKAALKSIFDTIVIETGGFQIFSDRERRGYIEKLARERGIIVMTDGDHAGQTIRSILRGSIPKDMVKHAYIPDIYGKERRKSAPSKEGKLGVEGMSLQVLTESVLRCGATVTEGENTVAGAYLTKADLYEDGILGGQNSAEKRRKLLKHFSLPETLTSNALLEALNTFVTREEYEKALEEI